MRQGYIDGRPLPATRGSVGGGGRRAGSDAQGDRVRKRGSVTDELVGREAYVRVGDRSEVACRRGGAANPAATRGRASAGVEGGGAPARPRREDRQPQHVRPRPAPDEGV